MTTTFGPTALLMTCLGAGAGCRMIFRFFGSSKDDVSYASSLRWGFENRIPGIASNGSPCRRCYALLCISPLPGIFDSWRGDG